MGDTRSQAQLLIALTQTEEALRAERERADAAMAERDLAWRCQHSQRQDMLATIAAMRAALEKELIKGAPMDEHRCSFCGDIRASSLPLVHGSSPWSGELCPLASDAGKKVLDVVEAAKQLRFTRIYDVSASMKTSGVHIWVNENDWLTLQAALAAMEG